MPKRLKLMHAAIDAYDNGDLHKADLICHQLLDMNYQSQLVLCLLALISCDIGELDFAEDYLSNAVKTAYLNRIDNESSNSFLRDMLKVKIKGKTSSGNFRARQEIIEDKKFLLIKAWGYGFWSDIDHVLGQLLLCEMTGRIPIVCWGSNSNYNTGKIDNAFELYFEPISQYTIHDMLAKDFTFYPPKWTCENLLSNDVNKWSGHYSCMTSIYFLNRPETVVVSDYYTALNDLIPWIKKSHPLYGLERESLYRYLIKKYLKLRPELSKEIDCFYTEKMQPRKPILAVHLRGADKAREGGQLKEQSRMCYNEIEKYIIHHPEASIFLLTDDNRIKDYFINQYSQKVIVTEAKRTDVDLGVHYHDGYSRYNLGREVIFDTFLAAKCDHFTGHAWSNLPLMVNYLKEWPAGSCVLLGENMHSARLIYLSESNQFMPMKLFMESL